MKESSLDPLSRKSDSPEFLSLPHYALPYRTTMQNLSTTPFTATPDQPQSIAALVPEEIVDLVIQHLSFDYSMDVDWQDYMERVECLSNVSGVVSGWRDPARRMLMRSVKLSTYEGLGSMPEWAGELVRTLELDFLRRVDHIAPTSVAPAVSKFLQRLPFLTTLSLRHLPFDNFSNADSFIPHSDVFLPHLRDLRLYTRHSQNLIHDILATSGHSISHLDISGETIDPSSEGERLSSEGKLDFKGNLRYLELRGWFHATILGDSPLHSVELVGLAGLTELEVDGVQPVSEDIARIQEVFKVIGPTLERLSLARDHKSTLDLAILPLVPRLSYLRLMSAQTNLFALHHLPPSLSSLSLYNDYNFNQVLAAWLSTPSKVPRGLKKIHIGYLHAAYTPYTLTSLPPIDTFGVSYFTGLLPALRLVESGPMPFKNFELKYLLSDEAEDIQEVEVQCRRLGVGFSKSLQ